ncbi:aldo/keto reductase [Aestuariicoccus sp. MJ-SS9]|uniref:aldo/keto reductase n=1 Tax=Aestuariicoccus sp. MJ-SS9 TaxID=3079855 RepID=UPI002908C965|nr:aldo/keto reductase [Aestuariicoccus sp. MJ-SS9]MDU8913495.1 aldo/keto reductase [Aestuariicoccus sp. MJ-SS9]
MDKRSLGQSGPEVSAVGIGGMSFSNFYAKTSEAEAHAVLDAALDLGVDHIDTANVYGAGGSESAIGTFLRRYRGGGQIPFRIATKASIRHDLNTGARSFDNSRAHLEAELDHSLKLLGVERVDLFYVHRRDTRFEIEEVTETLAGFVRAGKIGAIGFSEIAPASLRRAAAVHPVAAVQSEYSLSTRAPELGLVQACEALGTALVAFSPVGRALLTDTPPTKARVAQSGFLSSNPRFTGANLARNLAATDPFRALARDMGVAAASLAIAWVLAQSPAAIAIPGTRSVAHLRELAAGGAMRLDPEAMARIETCLPVGWAHGARYSDAQAIGPEHYC